MVLRPSGQPAGAGGGAGGGAATFAALLDGLPPELLPPDEETPRGKILVRARGLFAERGFSRTSVRAIAGAARVNPAMIHYYFGKKNLLYRRVIAVEIVSTMRGVFESLEPELPASEILVRIPLGMMRELRGNRERLLLLRRELAEGGHEARRAIEELSRHGPLAIPEIVGAVVRRGQEEGSLRPLPVRSILPFLATVGYGSMILDPFFRIVLGADLEDEAAWSERLSGFEALVRHGLCVEESSDV
jgi:AcrR family transcriptional regulator